MHSEERRCSPFCKMSSVQSCAELLLCTEVSNGHLLAELRGSALVLVVAQVPGLIKAGPRL